MLLDLQTKQMLRNLRFSGGMVYLFRGNKGMGRMTYAKSAVSNFLGVKKDGLIYHPDYFEISTEGRLGISDLDSLRSFTGYVPVQAPCKVVVIDAAALTDEAQASILKLLEDGATHCMFILICNGRILSTIESRCRVIEFYEISRSQMEVLGEPVVARDLAAGKPGLFYELKKSEYDAYRASCSHAADACKVFDKVRLLEALHLVREKDKDAFYEKYGKDLTVLFFRYLGDRIQDVMLDLSEADLLRWDCYREMVRLAYGEYIRIKGSSSYSKNDFFEFVRCMCTCCDRAQCDNSVII